MDFVRRLRAVLPARWFADDAPVLDSVLAGLAETWRATEDLIGYARLQTRIRTATGEWLDLIAADYFGIRVRRNVGQADTPFRARILREIMRPRVTRGGLIRALTELTGYPPLVFEPANPLDTGGYSFGGLGWNVAGGYGSIAMPAQGFVTAYRPPGGGIASVAGWGGSIGGYGVGAVEWAALDMRRDQVTDQDILDAVVDVLPVGAIAWVTITVPPTVARWGVSRWNDGSTWG